MYSLLCPPLKEVLYSNKQLESKMGKRAIFVTVGTTRFDLLIEMITQPSALDWMKSNGYTDLIIQYGKGNEPIIPENTAAPLKCQTYSFQSSLEKDMKEADLIISHAGAGTVMEGLRLKKRMVVVINTLLMDNHQTELANAMAKRGHLSVVEKPTDLQQLEIWNDFDSFVPIPHEGGDEQHFARLLDAHMGVQPNEEKTS
jgi:beta-1,4-N-acetylglucosaminyltransferase